MILFLLVTMSWIGISIDTIIICICIQGYDLRLIAVIFFSPPISIYILKNNFEISQTSTSATALSRSTSLSLEVAGTQKSLIIIFSFLGPNCLSDLALNTANTCVSLLISTSFWNMKAWRWYAYVQVWFVINNLFSLDSKYKNAGW